MGNWKNRIPRRFYHQKSPDYPPRYNLHDPLPDYRDDGVPVWEKKFCTKIGKVPWWKIVDAKKFMSYCHGNIVSWNDSAGEEAFQNAKKRYWAEINGRSCDISLPDPDMYIDEINWNLDVVPGLSEDLEQECLVPDDGEKENDEDHKNKRTRNLLFIPPEGWHSNSNEVDDAWPWECNNDNYRADALNSKDGWGKCDDDIHNSGNLENNNKPWEYSIPWGNKGGERTEWGGPDDKLLGSNQWGANVNQLANLDAGNSWKCGEVNSMHCNGWGDLAYKSCGWNQQIPDNLDNERNHWKQDPIKPRTHDSRGSSYGDRYIGGRKQQEHQNVWPRKSDTRRSNWHSDPWYSGGGQKRGSYQNTADPRNHRYQRDSGQRGQYWSVKANKRVSFAPEQPVI